MSFSTYLVKVGSYEIPLKMIQADSYKIVKTVVDLDSYRDADGKLHRTALEHIPHKIEFNTIPMLTNAQMSDFMGKIRKQFTNERERRCKVTFYVPETDSYEVQDMYMPDINFQIYGVFNDVIRYDAVRLAFISY